MTPAGRSRAFRTRDSARSRPVWLAALLFTACINAPAGAGCPMVGRPEPIDPNCHGHSTTEYLDALRGHIAKVYARPDGFNDDGYVDVRFTLARDGSVASRCIVRSTHRVLAESVFDALDAVRFPEVPHYARCVVGREIRRELYTVKR